MLNNASRIPALLLLSALVSCGQEAAVPQAEVVAEAAIPAQEHASDIHWYDGTVDAAFALAEAEDKPLFFYWGAIWCPPCEQIKATVFKHPGFLTMMDLFVPVYLDGDTERAQSWGEHFAVAGYPTMIVFSPTGDEITRIPGWIDSTQYINVLQIALDDLTSTPDLLHKALTEPASLKANAWTRLAFYSWEQSNLPDDVKMDAATFGKLAESAREAGNTIAWSRLMFHALYAAGVAMETDDSAFTQAQRQQARQDLDTILHDRDMTLANSDYLLLYFSDFTDMLATGDASDEALADNWIAAMEVLRSAPQLSGAEHLASWYPSVERFFNSNPDAERLPADLEQTIIDSINAEDSETRGDARQNVINTAYQLLFEAKRPDLSRQILLDEIGKSHAPYYFMSSLGGLAEEAGNNAEAVDWHRQAYEGSKGEATRFQWGYQYVASMIQLAPEQAELIASTALGLLEEFQDRENILTGRNFGRLQSLVADLQEWQAATGDASALAPFYANLESLCSNTSVTGETGEHCESLLQAGL